MSSKGRVPARRQYLPCSPTHSCVLLELISSDVSCFLLPSAGSLKRVHEEDEELGTMQVAAAQNG